MDTSCSTSLIALLMGISHIRSGESDFAIICSTNLNESPGITVSLQRLGVLSPEGVCKSFDASGMVLYSTFQFYLNLDALLYSKNE